MGGRPPRDLRGRRRRPGEGVEGPGSLPKDAKSKDATAKKPGKDDIEKTREEARRPKNKQSMIKKLLAKYPPVIREDIPPLARKYANPSVSKLTCKVEPGDNTFDIPLTLD
jgi:hypothetical protein